VDPATFSGFLETSRRELLATLRELEQAVGSGALDMAGSLAGTLRAICASIGAGEAAQCAARVGEGARRGDPARHLPRLRAAVERLMQRLDGR